jgi:hypothetical protein
LKLFDQTEGFQIRRVRQIRKIRPAWAATRLSIAQKLAPRASRRIEIAYLYWNCGWGAQHIADKLGCSRRAVTESVLRMRNL